MIMIVDSNVKRVDASYHMPVLRSNSVVRFPVSMSHHGQSSRNTSSGIHMQRWHPVEL